MVIDTNLDKMDELLEEAWNLPFTGGKRMIDIEKMRNLIDDIRLNLPRELKEAKAIAADREDILRSAEREAEEIVRRAEKKAKVLVSHEEISKAAREKATEILTEAAKKARELQNTSVGFADGTLQASEAALSEALKQVKDVRARLRKK